MREITMSLWRLTVDNIEAFCKATGLKFKADGEVGFGRPCAGILDPGEQSYIDTAIYDENTLDTLAELTVEAPSTAYHKHRCLACLHSDGRDKAITDLDEWLGRIIARGYEIKRYTVRNNIRAFLKDGEAISIAVVDP